MKMQKDVDKIFLTLLALLLLGGFFIFISASFGLLARGGVTFGNTVFNQGFFGLVLGTVALFITSRIHYRVWRKWSLPILVLGLILTALVFIPQLGYEHAGARRWLALGPFSFQPAEVLKFALVLYLATWFSAARDKVKTFKFGFAPFLVLLGISGGLLLAQPDTGTFIVLAGTATALFIIAGAHWKHILILFMTGLIVFAGLIFTRPYIMDRVLTFVDPSRDPAGAGWQIKQSLIAIGTGGIAGKGFGQSIQKFNYLPEPVGDSIFAVAAEEFGFVGAITILALFIAFLARGLYIARRVPDTFSGLFVSGIVIMIVLQSFINIASMLGVFPLTGLPLIFISHGGSALFITLASMGIVLNVSRYRRSV